MAPAPPSRTSPATYPTDPSMLVITRKQLARLDALRCAEFRRVCARAIRDRHADDAEAFDDPLLAEMIGTVDQTATGRFGISAEEQRFRLMVLALRHPELWRQEPPPAVVDLMTWPDRADERKLSMLEAHLKSAESTASDTLPAAGAGEDA